MQGIFFINLILKRVIIMTKTMKMRISETIDYYIRTTHLSLTRIYSEILRDYGLTPTIALILVSVRKEGTPITKLASYMGMQDSSLSRQLKKMEHHGYITRRQDHNDKRVSNIFLTAKGLEYRRLVKQLVVDFNNMVLSALTDAEKNTFFELFDKIRNQINATEAKIIKTKNHDQKN